MKDDNMTAQQNSPTCTACGLSLIYIDHWEYDGVTENGSHEPYWECPDGCEQEEDEN